MTPKLIAAKYLNEFRLELTFADGLKSIVDLRSQIMSHGGIWLPLHDPAYFRQFRIDPELQTIVWPNGVDICPDLLYQWASSKLERQPNSAPAA
jgi:hypothetical protein